MSPSYCGHYNIGRLFLAEVRRKLVIINADGKLHVTDKYPIPLLD